MVSRAPLPVTVVTATALEYRQARKLLPARVRVIRAGISLRAGAGTIGGLAISCGLAGGLRNDLPTGSALIPHHVRRPDGTSVACDPEYVSILSAAARDLGVLVCNDPLLTSTQFICGAARTAWAAHGFAGADMESGLIHAERLACVRIVLDTPGREISPAWLSGVRAAFDPRAWIDLPFLARNGPACARSAALIVARAV
ncbi:MAG: hypothetical protein ABR508_06730 [Candidatus Baltobacteraceae bacterium]